MQEIHVIKKVNKWSISITKDSSDFRSYKYRFVAIIHAVIIGRHMNHCELHVHKKDGKTYSITRLRR